MSILAIIGAVGAVQGAISGALSLWTPAQRGLQYWSNRTQPNLQNDPTVLLTLHLKGKMDIFELNRRMREHGFDTDSVKEQLTAIRRTLDISNYLVLWRRGLIEHAEVVQKAEAQGLTIDEVTNLELATRFYPSVGDIIRFAVRDVYTPAVVKEMGLLEDVPEEYLQAAYKIGLGREDATSFWGAHWGLPSINMGFEMLHRGVINQNQMDILLKAADVMPYWRPKLQQIAYAPYTRVDARRMYGFGVLSEDDLLQTYMDIGYDKAHATKLKQFTIAYEDDEFTGITRSNIVTAYTKGLISESDMQYYFSSMNYSPVVTEFWTAYAVQQKTVSEIDARKEELKVAFLDGALTLDEIRNVLLSDGVNDTYLDTVLRDFERASVTMHKSPTPEKLLVWLELGVIDAQIYYKYMRRLGYDVETITYYMTEIYERTPLVKRKFLQAETYQEWYVSGIIDYNRLVDTLTLMGYDEDDRAVLVLQAEEQKGALLL